MVHSQMKVYIYIESVSFHNVHAAVGGRYDIFLDYFVSAVKFINCIRLTNATVEKAFSVFCSFKMKLSHLDIP